MLDKTTTVERGGWTEERVELLKRMWASEVSASDIAEAFGTTRNAVLGKIQRLGLADEFKPVWTEEKVAQLIKCWCEGLSYRQIGARLGLSRNTVMGKGTRLNLSEKYPRAPLPTTYKFGRSQAPLDRASGVNKPRPRRSEPKTRAVTVIKVRSPSHGGTRVEPVVVREPDPDLEQFNAAIPLEQRRQLLDEDFDHTRCHFPVGHPSEPGFFYCGGSVDEGRVYCPTHMRIAYRVSPAPKPNPYFPDGHTRA